MEHRSVEDVEGIGIDIVEVRRVRVAVERWGERFLGRVFTQEEVDYCLGRRQGYGSLAGRFAVKEAVFKAVGTGWKRGVTWKDVEVVRKPGERPDVRLSGEVKNIVKDAHVLISISHTQEHAIAVAVMTKRRDGEKCGDPNRQMSQGGDRDADGGDRSGDD
ncbi:MAG: holo-ACP synthase [Candidatus Latescibacteria bacterium]|nr:holo-ACP synthase [Candidatus Latescibacterota bacterium]